MKRHAIALGIAAALSAAGLAANAETGATEENSPWNIGEVQLANPFDPSTWWDGSGDNHEKMERVAINPMNPEFWMGFVRPDTHTRMHMTFTDPATMAQFFDPKTYQAMADPDILAKWIDPETYSPLVDPQTYAYWMQPGAYMHVMEPTHYAQLLNPEAYTEVFAAAAAVVNLDHLVPDASTEE